MPDYAALAKKHGGIARSQPPPASPPPASASDETLSPRAARAIDKLDDVVFGVPLPPVGQALRGTGGVMGRAWATAKAAAGQAAPALKYEAAKTALEQMGIPTSLAIPVAIGIAGAKRGGRASAKPRPAATTAASSPQPVAAAPVSPVASSPVAPAPPAATGAPPQTPGRTAAPIPRPQTGQAWSPQRIRNEVGLAERRNGLKLTEAQREAADRLVAQGVDPKSAVTTVSTSATAAPPVPAPAPTPTVTAAPKARLTAAEVNEYKRMVQAGKTPAEAYKAIDLQRQFAQQFGTPSPEQARRAVADRNATGRWRKE